MSRTYPVQPPGPPCPFDPPCWWCSNPDRWRVVDNEIVRLDADQSWDPDR